MHRGFRLDDRSTWNRQIDFSWDAAEMKVIEQVFLPMFPAGRLEEVAAALRHFLGYMHGKANGEVAMKMWHLPFSQFPMITLGNRAKLAAFKKKLLEVGWLYQRAAYRPPPRKGVKGRATSYAVAGSVRRKLLAVDAAVEMANKAKVEDVWPEWLVEAVGKEEVALLLH